MTDTLIASAYNLDSCGTALLPELVRPHRASALRLTRQPAIDERIHRVRVDVTMTHKEPNHTLAMSPRVQCATRQKVSKHNVPCTEERGPLTGQQCPSALCCGSRAVSCNGMVRFVSSNHALATWHPSEMC